MKKGFSLLLLLLILVCAAAIGTGGYFGYRYYQDGKDKDKSSPTPSKSAADDAAGWKTYTSEKLGFSFNYPPTWTYTDTGYSNENWNNLRSYSASFTPAELYIEVNPWTVSASPLAHAYDNFEKIATKTVKLDGVDATSNTWQTTAAGAEIEKGEYKIIDLIFLHGTDKFTVNFRYNASTGTDQFADYNNLIDSWKFSTTTTTDQYSGWKTYTNTEVGYRLQYPPTWNVEFKTDDGMPEIGTAKYLLVTTANGNKLYFGIRKEGVTAFVTSSRTGIGAGEDVAVAGKSTTLLGGMMIPKAHVWEDKTKEYFFYFNPDSESTKCNCDLDIWFDPGTADGWDVTNTGATDLDNVLLFLKSVVWL